MATNNACDVPLSGNTGTGNFVGSNSPTLITPVLGVATATSLQFSGNDGLIDSNGNEILSLAPQPSAVNYCLLYNNVTGQPPGLNAVGTDTNIGLRFATKGTGLFQFESTAALTAIFYSGTNYQHLTEFTFPTTLATQVVTFPDATGTVTLLGNTATGTGSVVLANTPTLITPVLGAATGTSLALTGNASANNFLSGYATTTTAATTTTLTVSSAYQQFFTGTTTQTVLLPVTSTLTLGQSFYIINNSTGNVTVKSSGTNNIQIMAGGSMLLVTCILTSGTTAASWNGDYFVNADVSGAVLLAPSGPQTITGYGFTAPSITFSSTSGIIGTTTNDSAATGSVGEFVDSGLVSNVSWTTTATGQNMTSISLTAGDWDVSFVIQSFPSASQTYCYGGITTVSASAPGAFGMGNFYEYTTASTGINTMSGQTRISIATTTTIYLAGAAVFVSAGTFFCQMTARRRR